MTWRFLHNTPTCMLSGGTITVGTGAGNYVVRLAVRDLRHRYHARYRRTTDSSYYAPDCGLVGIYGEGNWGTGLAARRGLGFRVECRERRSSDWISSMRQSQLKMAGVCFGSASVLLTTFLIWSAT